MVQGHAQAPPREEDFDEPLPTAPPRHRATALCVAAVAALAAPTPTCAQMGQQQVSPPVAHAWIDVATATGLGGMGAMAGMAGGNPMAAIGSLFGGSGDAKNVFGHTRTQPPGRWVDVMLSTRANPNLAEATMSVPAGSGLAPTLELVTPKTHKQAPTTDDEPPAEDPRGKISLYWGCGEAVRPGQPRTVDLSKMSLQAAAAELAQIFRGRRATQRGAHEAADRPIWPNEQDARFVPTQASLVGEHGFAGSGVPEGFRFALPAATTIECTVPRGTFGDGAMLRAIAYGNELNLVHPPRPTNPKMAWEPHWAVKVRVKSVAMAMLGDDGEAESAGGTAPATAPEPPPAAAKPEDPLQKSIGVLRGILGR